MGPISEPFFIIAFLGLLVGNLIRQWLPFIRKYLSEGNDIQWDSTYTRRLLLSVGLAFGAAWTGQMEFLIPPGTSALNLFMIAIIAGVNENWLLEELAKWEWSTAKRKLTP